ncbi:MAG TPA: ABC transporter ATP-binding protein [Solirubrobacteraceae bacterium]|nr:ABC transporter ATP-binding protein [Solirubrobacteraceae bacterium]
MPRGQRPFRRPAVERGERALAARLRRRESPSPEKPATAPPTRRPRLSNVPVVDLQNVYKTYAVGNIAVHALNGISFRVQQGEYVAIIGASGSGKSTLMNIIGCLDAPTSGTYRLNGHDVRGVDEDTLADVRNHEIGFVFQSFNLIPRTRALANVELPLMYAGMHRAERQGRAQAALEQVGLRARVNHFPSELSGGQQQRVAIARALVTNPAMILADEPTGALDTHSSAEVLNLFGRVNAQGRTVILITHEADVAAHARRLIRISDGRIVEDSASPEVVRKEKVV